MSYCRRAQVDFLVLVVLIVLVFNSYGPTLLVLQKQLLSIVGWFLLQFCELF